MDLDPSATTSLDLSIDAFSSNETDFATPSTGHMGFAGQADDFSQGLTATLTPLVEKLDSSVKATRLSQIQLRTQIDSLAEDLRVISENYQAPYELDGYVKKLQDSRKRVAVVSSILQNAQERLRKLQKSIEKETAKRVSMIEAPLPPPLP